MTKRDKLIEAQIERVRVNRDGVETAGHIAKKIGNTMGALNYARR